jgi:ATP-dependent phosphofructokinase / diphosphate-dependent phosphofructokinase
LIPEYPFDLGHICNLLMEDKRNNPSNYALVIVSEGAAWKEGSVEEYGEADAFGHRKKVDIGHALGEEIKKRTGQEIMESDLTYDLRSGEPDAIDKLVAITYANIAVDLIRDGVHGRLVGVQNGCYSQVALAGLPSGARKVDIARMYNTERYRPNYTSKLGAPLLFNRLERIQEERLALVRVAPALVLWRSWPEPASLWLATGDARKWLLASPAAAGPAVFAGAKSRRQP